MGGPLRRPTWCRGEGSARGDRGSPLYLGPARAGHRLHAGRQAYLELTSVDGVGDVDCASQRRRQAVDGDGGHRVRKAGGEGAPTGNVAHALMVGVTSAGDVLDPSQRHAHPFARRHHCLPQQIVGAHMRQSAAVAAERRAHAAENEGLAHRTEEASRVISGTNALRARRSASAADDFISELLLAGITFLLFLRCGSDVLQTNLSVGDEATRFVRTHPPELMGSSRIERAPHSRRPAHRRASGGSGSCL